MTVTADMAVDAAVADMAVVDAAVAVDTVDAAAAVATTAMMIEIKSRGFSDVYTMLDGV